MDQEAIVYFVVDGEGESFLEDAPPFATEAAALTFARTCSSPVGVWLSPRVFNDETEEYDNLGIDRHLGVVYYACEAEAGDRFEYQDENDETSDADWLEAKTILRRRGLRLHDTGDDYRVVAIDDDRYRDADIPR
jgi:hypothetical protein